MTHSTFCLDARTVHSHFPGVGRYAANIATALVACLDADERLVVLRDPRHPVSWIDTSQSNPRLHTVDVTASPFSLIQQAVVPRLLRAAHASLYHSPYYLMPYWPRVPTVVTLHDLIPLRYPRLFSPPQRLVYQVATRLAVRAAQRIIAVSVATAHDISQRLRVPAERIVIIPEAADPIFQPQPAAAITTVCARLNVPRSYALYVGSNKPHKNLVRLIEAWARVRTGDTVLAIAGVWDARFPQAQERAVALGVGERVRFLGPVPDADLAALYS
ncbi:MAG: glycosyltransferase family 4 protein, partial [Gaiellaceae bacterium]